MAAYLLANLPARLTNTSGSPAQSLYTYTTGTTTPKTAYSDQAGLVPLANPVPADAFGSFPQVWLNSDAEYRVKVICQDGTTLFTWDDVSGLGASIANLTSANIAHSGRTVAAKLGERVSVKDKGAATTNTRSQNDAAFTNALNSGAKTIFVPNSYPDKYLLSARIAIQAAAQGIALVGEDKLNTILSWQIDTATTDKFGLALDGFVKVRNLTLENTGTDATNSCAVVSYSPTTSNGMRDCRFDNVKLLGSWGVGIGGSTDNATLTLTRSQAFSNVFTDVEFNGVTTPISLGVGVNNNTWIRPKFISIKGTRFIKLVEGSSNLFLSPQFEPVDSSVGTGVLQAELVRSPNNVFMNPYLEPCYGFLADASPGTIIDSPIVESFDFTKGTLSSSAILRSTDSSNAGVYASPLFNHVRTPVSRAAVNPASYCASDDNTNTVTLVDGFTSRDANFKLKPAGQTSRLSINTQGTNANLYLAGSTAGGGAANTYSQRSDQWIRCGNLVTEWGRIALTAKDAGMTGNAVITGLRFPVATIAQYSPPIVIAEYGAVDLTAGYTQLCGEAASGGTTIALTQGGDNVAAIALPVAGITATSVIIFQITYITDAA